MKPRLSLCMIVRDEAASLPRCLDSVAGVVDEMVVVDTGSRDDTVAVAQSYGARVLHHPWSGDFAAARNAALDGALGEWVLVLDADEQLHPDDRALIRPLLLAGNVEGYLSTQVNFTGDTAAAGEAEYGHGQRLFRNRPEYRYHGRIHEWIKLPDDRVQVAPVRILHDGYLPQVVEDRQKRERNMALLEQLIVEQPDDIRLYFYLGTEYRAVGRDAEAVEAYRKGKSALKEGYMYTGKLVKNLAASLMAIGQPREALVELAEGLAVFPDLTDLVYLQGLAYRQLNRLPEAIGAFHQCLALGPAKVPPHHGVDPGFGGWKALHQLGHLHEVRGEPERADRFYRRAWLAGRNPATLGRLARLLLVGQGPGAARLALEDLVGAESHGLLAGALLEARDWEGALQHTSDAQSEALCRYYAGDYRRAAELLPDRPETPEGLAAILTGGSVRPAGLTSAELRKAVRGCLNGAVATLEQGLLRRPDSPTIQQALARVLAEVKRLG